MTLQRNRDKPFNSKSLFCFAGVTHVHVNDDDGAQYVVLNGILECHLDLDSFVENSNSNGSIFRWAVVLAMSLFAKTGSLREDASQPENRMSADRLRR